ncbi:MAG: peptidoglycan DD-metalloendopeptidase family protein [Bacilli bacterium]|nr:peptidoglycan DD-metalloendopeptidase family protein [Bacilli bacterium]MDD4298959.1 peptidoglycan DD-metalloendopeptidase family protein [Bacilli bacterium]MDD4644037.1 peptidoglycan DD-metalloendopeptidase family protein [Bacilli bacterium]
MLLLGSKRAVTQDYKAHGDAEDYAGEHLSIIKIKGKAKVKKVVNKYNAHEDTINYNDFMNNKIVWRDETHYNCVSITGKVVRCHQSELGGNQVELECYEEGKKRTIRILHMADVLVNVGDIIDSDTIIGKQGNTGLVLSSRARSDITYGSHVHFEVLDENYQSVDPREYALFSKEVDYMEQTNVIDNSKKQIKVIVDKINIRLKPSVNSSDIGNVYSDEIYDVLGITEDEKYIWYHIKTNLEVSGYIANEKGQSWLTVINEGENIMKEVKEVDQLKELKLIFTCEKDGMYAVKLKLGEKVYIE